MRSLFIALLCSSAAGFQSFAAERPNIVFILADDMNRDCWGVYGSENCKTPNIDKLAGEGIRFDHAYCTVAMCAPFRQELYSGRTPWRTGTLPNHSRSKAGTKSIAHYLKPLGYRVALLGKSHVGPKKCYPFEYLPCQGRKSEDRNPFYVESAGRFVDECTRQDKPFCLFICSNDSHAPFTTGDRTMYDPAEFKIPPYWLDTPKLRSELVKYYAEVTNFDSLVGDMRKELEHRNLWDKTLFIVCSEQGAQLPFAKWTCYDNGLHTGLVAHWSGVIRPGSVAEDLVSMADVTPTLVDVAGGELKPSDCDGVSFLELLKGRQQSLHKYVYGAFSNCNIIGNRTRVYPIRAIRNRKFTLLYNPNYKQRTSNVSIDEAMAMLDDPSRKGTDIASSWVKLSRKDASAKPLVRKLRNRPEYELYNLENDPYELVNQINNLEYQSVAKELKQQLHGKLKELGDPDPIATEKALVKTDKKKARSEK